MRIQINKIFFHVLPTGHAMITSVETYLRMVLMSAKVKYRKKNIFFILQEQASSYRNLSLFLDICRKRCSLR